MTPREFLSDLWQMLIGRVEGPFTFRLIMQPIVASFLAARAALRDARNQRRPFFWLILREPGKRRRLIREGWKDVRNVFLVALAFDVIYQLVRFRWVYLGQAVIVATVLAIVPYLLIRGPLNRLASRIPRLRDAASRKTLSSH